MFGKKLYFVLLLHIASVNLQTCNPAGRHQGPLSKESLQNAAHTSQIMKC